MPDFMDLERVLQICAKVATRLLTTMRGVQIHVDNADPQMEDDTWKCLHLGVGEVATLDE